MTKGIKDMPVVTKAQIIAIFRDHPEGMSYKELCKKALSDSNPTYYLCERKVKPNYMSLCNEGVLVAHGSIKDIRILVEKVKKEPVFPPYHVNGEPPLAPMPSKPTNALNQAVLGVNFCVKKRGTIADRYLNLLHQVTFETRPLQFDNAFVWVGPTDSIDSGPWFAVGQVEGNRIVLSEVAPDMKAMPYAFKYIKLFLADHSGTNEGTYYLAQLNDEWIAWVGSLDRVK